MKIGIVSNAAYCLPLLQVLVANNIAASVFTDTGSDQQPDTELIAHFCQVNRIAHQTASADTLYFWLEESRPDIVLVMGYRHLIDVRQVPADMLNHFYNVHFGALPKYRGANPVFWQLKNGEEHLTVTIHRVNEKFDAGAAVWSRSIKREPHMSYGVANMVLSQVVVEGVVYIIQHVLQKHPLPAIAQNQHGKKYYHRPGLNDVLISWENMHANEVINLVLACNPWNKGAVTLLNGRELKIIDAEAAGNAPPHDIAAYLPGTIINTAGTVQILCAGRTIVNLNTLNIEGTFIPGRHAALFGFAKGVKLGV